MDRQEKPKKSTAFANTGQVSEEDAAALASVTGREPDLPSLAASDIAQSVGMQRRSEVTGRHDTGSGANETADGLNSSEEAVRQGAEEIPIGAPEEDIEDLPVFDRADALPKV
jgi:hypothetical protein